MYNVKRITTTPISTAWSTIGFVLCCVVDDDATLSNAFPAAHCILHPLHFCIIVSWCWCANCGAPPCNCCCCCCRLSTRERKTSIPTDILPAFHSFIQQHTIQPAPAPASPARALAVVAAFYSIRPFYEKGVEKKMGERKQHEQFVRMTMDGRTVRSTLEFIISASGLDLLCVVAGLLANGRRASIVERRRIRWSSYYCVSNKVCRFFYRCCWFFIIFYYDTYCAIQNMSNTCNKVAFVVCVNTAIVRPDYFANHCLYIVYF